MVINAKYEYMMLQREILEKELLSIELREQEGPSGGPTGGTTEVMSVAERSER